MLPFKLVALDLHLSPTPAASVDHQVSTSIPLLLRFRKGHPDDVHLRLRLEVTIELVLADVASSQDASGHAWKSPKNWYWPTSSKSDTCSHAITAVEREWFSRRALMLPRSEATTATTESVAIEDLTNLPW